MKRLLTKFERNINMIKTVCLHEMLKYIHFGVTVNLSMTACVV